MLLPLFGLIIGVILGVVSPFVFPPATASYVAIGILACLDSVLGGAKSMLEENFNLSIFLTGFFANAAIAIFLTWLGKQLSIELSLAAVVVFGSRLFQNFASIRRFILNKKEKQYNIE